MPATAQPLSYVKTHLAEVVAQVRGGGAPVFITQDGTDTAVIQDSESYRRTQDALSMLKLAAIADAQIAQGGGLSHAEVFSAARERLRRRQREQA
jgi:prevent-host-death family protein